jgi:hypothetical protein
MFYVASQVACRSFTVSDLSGLVDADSTPTAALRRCSGGTISTLGTLVTVTTNGTGDYSAKWTMPAAGAAGDTFELVVSYVVGGLTQKQIEGLVAYVRLVDPAQSGDLWYRRPCTSDADGLVSWELLQDADYQIKFGKGAWVDFHTGTNSTYQITPQVLGEYGS